jgi:hypothetical protein
MTRMMVLMVLMCLCCCCCMLRFSSVCKSVNQLIITHTHVHVSVYGEYTCMIYTHQWAGGCGGQVCRYTYMCVCMSYTRVYMCVSVSKVMTKQECL